jgi:hypothetical protein
MSGRRIADGNFEGPTTLHRVIQAAIVHGLKQHYKPQRHMPHELFVLMMQMNDSGWLNPPDDRARHRGGRSPPLSCSNNSPLLISNSFLEIPRLAFDLSANKTLHQKIDSIVRRLWASVEASLQLRRYGLKNDFGTCRCLVRRCGRAHDFTSDPRRPHLPLT